MKTRLATAYTLVLLGLASGCNRIDPGPESSGLVARAGATEAPTRSTPEEKPRQIAPAKGPYFYKRVVVLSIGVSQYRSPAVESLNYAASDAQAVADQLHDLYGYETKLLIGPEATKHAIEETLDRYDEQLGDRDALIVFFAGHGKAFDLPAFGRVGYLVPYDADLNLSDTSNPARWAEQAIDVHRLAERVQRMQAQHVLFVVDACFSGLMALRGTIEFRTDLRMLPKWPSRAVLSATTASQVAGENAATCGGYFTSAFLDQLKTYSEKNQAESVSNLFEKVRQQVMKATSSRGKAGMMTPQLSTTGEGQFVFLPLSISPEIIAKAGLAGGEVNIHHELVADMAARSLERTARFTTLAQVIEPFQGLTTASPSTPGRKPRIGRRSVYVSMRTPHSAIRWRCPVCIFRGPRPRHGDGPRRSLSMGRLDSPEGSRQRVGPFPPRALLRERWGTGAQ